MNDNGSTKALDRRSQWLGQYRFEPRIREHGVVVAVGDGIAWISGLPSAALDDVLVFEDGSRALVFDLNEDLIGAVLLHETERLTSGMRASISSSALTAPAGDALLGRIIDPLGFSLDEQEAPVTTARQPLYRPAPPIIAREPVNRPLYTGIKIIDSMVPIGRGQRQLLIGDEGLGRTSLALDTLINQKGRQVHCIYVLVGQKRSTVVNVIETLRRFGALEYTTVVVAEASALPGLQYLAPFCGCALAEFWMARGQDTLVIYDDLSAHARTYRELSLLLRRPPGREAYPGDIFSIHARLLERATALSTEHGGGTMTALPIVETQQGEIAAYIPTNLISITDGQIYLDRGLFSAGFRPAIDIARSVSRIGGQAQHPRIKQEAGRMKLDYLQFLELEVFTRFGARLEASMEKAINKGRLLRELLKQDRLSPLSEAVQLGWMIAFNEGLFDPESPEQAEATLSEMIQFLPDKGLTLQSPREAWRAALSEFMAARQGEPSR